MEITNFFDGLRDFVLSIVASITEVLEAILSVLTGLA